MEVNLQRLSPQSFFPTMAVVDLFVLSVCLSGCDASVFSGEETSIATATGRTFEVRKSATSWFFI